MDSPPAKAVKESASPIDEVKMKANDAFAALFFKRLGADLKLRKRDIENRIEQQQWFQDTAKNKAKINAIDTVVKAINSGKNPLEILEVIQENRRVLVESTSTLQTFFRSKVSTVAILEESDKLNLSCASN